MFEASKLKEAAITTGTVGGQFITGGPNAGKALFWQVAKDSQSRWNSKGFLKTGKTKLKSPRDDEKERRKWLSRFSLLSLYRRNPVLKETSTSRHSGATAYSMSGLSVHSRQPVGAFRFGDPSEFTRLPIHQKTKTYDDYFLKASFLDRIPHKKTDIEKLTNKQWSDIQKYQNKSTDDPRWVWKRRLRYAGTISLKDYNENFRTSKLKEGS